MSPPPANSAPAIASRPHWSRQVKTSLLGPSLVALLVAGGGVGGFVAWGATAPLAGAVIAAGNVAASGENQIVIETASLRPQDRATLERTVSRRVQEAGPAVAR